MLSQLRVNFTVFDCVFRRLFQGVKLSFDFLHTLCVYEEVVLCGVQLSFSVGFLVRHDSAEGEKQKISDKKKDIDERIEYLAKRMEELLAEYRDCRKSLDDADVTLQDLNDRIRRYEGPRCPKTVRLRYPVRYCYRTRRAPCRGGRGFSPEKALTTPTSLCRT